MQPSMPNTPGPDAPPGTPNASIGHEPHRFNIRAVVMAGVCLTGISIAALVVVAGIMRGLEPAEKRPDPMMTGRRVLPEDITKIREPVLQDSNADDLIALRKKEAALLAEYGWVDRAKGVVRVPIERAMELVAEEREKEKAKTQEKGR
jgi:hypothetical protein